MGPSPRAGGWCCPKKQAKAPASEVGKASGASLSTQPGEGLWATAGFLMAVVRARHWEGPWTCLSPTATLLPPEAVARGRGHLVAARRQEWARSSGQLSRQQQLGLSGDRTGAELLAAVLGGHCPGLRPRP